MATSTTYLSLIKPELSDTSKIREDFNTNMDTIDGRFSATYMAVQAKNAVSITGGSITGITDLVVSDGGTGVSTLTDGGVLLGSGTGAITAMAVLTDGQMIVGNGTTDPVAESGATLRTSIGVAIGTNVQAYDAALTSISGLTYVSGSFIALTATDTYTVRTYAQTRSDINAAILGANNDITSLSAITGTISTPTNISMTGELDLTGALATIDLNPAGQTSKDIVTITPTATLNATQVWCAVNIDGSALDPNGVDSEIIGYQVNLSGIDETNSPIIHGARLNVPFGSDALHIAEGQLHIDTVLPSTAASEFTNIDIVIDSSALVSTSEYHAIDVATTGTPAGNVVAIGTHAGIEVIHQHIASFATPSQTEFAGVKHTGGTIWADGIDAYGAIFAAVSDAIYVGDAAQFSEIEVIMTTGGSKSIQPTFWYNTAADTWTQFFPADDTDGFQQSGEIRWDVSSITATWTNDGDPGVGDTTAGYWIKIVRTRIGTVGSPDPATVKIGSATEYSWNKDGDINVHKIVSASNADITIQPNGTGDTIIYAPSDVVTTKTAAATLTIAEAGTVLVSCAATPYTITLPTASGHTGLRYHFIKTDANYNLITLEGDGAETFNYENSTGTPNLTYLRLNTYCAEVTIVSDNANWVCVNEELGQVPECLVYLGATQENLTSNTWVLVNLNTESYDIGSNFNTTTHQFTAPISGKYEFKVFITYLEASIEADKVYQGALKADGTTYHLIGTLHSAIATKVLRIDLSKIIALSATNYMELYTYTDVAGNVADLAGGNDYSTWLQARLISKN